MCLSKLNWWKMFTALYVHIYILDVYLLYKIKNIRTYSLSSFLALRPPPPPPPPPDREEFILFLSFPETNIHKLVNTINKTNPLQQVLIKYLFPPSALVYDRLIHNGA